MLEYVSHYFNIKNNVVEKNFKVNSNKFTYDILYDYSPLLKLPDSIEEFKSSHKGKFWYNLRRSKKIFNNEVGEFMFEKYYDQDAFLYLDDLRKIFLDKWKNSYTSFSWKSKSGFDKFKSEIKKIIIKNPSSFEISLFKLKNDNTIIAFSIGFILKGTYYFYMHNINVNYNKPSYSLGTLFLEELITSFIAKPNLKTFDFMTGLNPYKLKWTKDIKPIFWRVETKKKLIYLPFHFFKIFFFSLKIKFQKNTFTSRYLKNIFLIMYNNRFSSKIIILFEKHIFKMR